MENENSNKPTPKDCYQLHNTEYSTSNFDFINMASITVACMSLLMLSLGYSVNAYHIVLLPLPWPSHFMQHEIIGRQLQRNGHRVTMLSSSNEIYINRTKSLDKVLYHPNLPNDVLVNMAKERIISNRGFGIGWLKEYVNILKTVGNSIMKSKEVGESMKNADLLVGDSALVVPTISADHYSVPIIFVSTFGHFVGLMGDLMGNLETLSYILMFLATALEEKIGLPQCMDFWQRSHNVFVYIINKIVRRILISPCLDPLALKYTNKGITDLCQNVPFVLIPRDFSVEYSRPLPPMVKMIGPLSVKKASFLSEPFRSIFSQSDNFIVVSFGAMDILPDTWVKELVKVFSKFNSTVLWRFSHQRIKTLCRNGYCRLREYHSLNVRRDKYNFRKDSDGSCKFPMPWFRNHNNCTTANKSGNPYPLILNNNIYIFDRIPQNDMLGDNRTALFISHCGINSLHEAIYHAIPVLCIPLFGDQFDNAGIVLSRELRLALGSEDIYEHKLVRTLKTVLADARYKINMQKVSKRLKRKKQTPAQKAAEWIEMVIAQGGDVEYLRPIGADLKFFIYFSLDVISAWGTLCIITFYLVYYILSLCIRSKNLEKNNVNLR